MRVCKVDGCDRPHLAKGYCGRHYQRLQAKGVAEAEVQHRDPDRGCLVDGCGAKHRAGGYCSVHYQRLVKKGDPLAEVQVRGLPDHVRFWAKVERAGPEDCWHWKAKKGSNQYGQYRSSDLGIPIGAHRFAFYLANGFLPEETMHTCDVRSCVNPRHLAAGTRSENMKDMIAKGRANNTVRAVGADHHMAKLTEQDVRDIRASSEGSSALARHYGVSVTAIYSIRVGKTWTHIT